MDQWTKLQGLHVKMKIRFEFALEGFIVAQAAKDNPGVIESTVGVVPDRDALAALLAEDDPQPPAHRLLDGDSGLRIGVGDCEAEDSALVYFNTVDDGEVEERDMEDA